MSSKRLEFKESKVHANLAPGSTVPESGVYKCEFCGKGGIADISREFFESEGRPTGHLNELAKQKKVLRSFEAGRKFTECPNCGTSTGWTLIEVTHLRRIKKWWEFWKK